MKFLEFLQGPSGEWSMKRAFAFLCFIVAVVVAFVTKDVAMVGVFLAPAAAVLIGAAATKT